MGYVPAHSHCHPSRAVWNKAKKMWQTEGEPIMPQQRDQQFAATMQMQSYLDSATFAVYASGQQVYNSLDTGNERVVLSEAESLAGELESEGIDVMDLLTKERARRKAAAKEEYRKTPKDRDLKF